MPSAYAYAGGYGKGCLGLNGPGKELFGTLYIKYKLKSKKSLPVKPYDYGPCGAPLARRAVLSHVVGSGRHGGPAGVQDRLYTIRQGIFATCVAILKLLFQIRLVSDVRMCENLDSSPKLTRRTLTSPQKTARSIEVSDDLAHHNARDGEHCPRT